VQTLESKRLGSSRVENERGDQGGGGDSTQSPTSTPLGLKGSKKNKPSRETCDPNNKLESHGNNKQKQTPSPLQSHPQSSVVLSTHVDFKRVTIKYQRILRGEMEIYSELVCYQKCVCDYFDRTSPISDFPPERK